MPYLVSYAVVGLLLALASLRHGVPSLSTGVWRFLLISCLWPLLLFVAPECIVGNRNSARPLDEFADSARELQRLATNNIDEPSDSVFGKLKKLSPKDITALSDEERDCLERVVKTEEYGTTFFSNLDDFDDVLNRFWNEAIPPEAYHLVNEARWHLSDDYQGDSGIRFSRQEPDWYIGFSTAFLKSISRIDKNKRARLLEALSKLAEAPVTPYGDTIKPLTGDLSGLWRYRINDDRLIYKPDSQSQRIVLVSFGARGGVYD